MDRQIRAMEKIRDQILRLPNVNGIGVGYKRKGLLRTKKPAVIIFVEKKVPASDLSRAQIIPAQIGGVETDVVELGRVRLLERVNKLRPALPGSSIGHYKISAGTFGAVVKDKKTGEKLILSNCHILANSSDGKDGRAFIGDPVLQPGAHDGGTKNDKIAELLRYIPLIRESQLSPCPVAAGVAATGNKIIKLLRPSYEMRFYKYSGFSNIVDCAVARPISPDLIGEEVLELGSVTGVGSVSDGLWVQKSGRTSGVSSGEVSARNVTLKVELSGQEVGWFSDQVVAELPCQPGDSGSLIMDKQNRAVGLLFAGTDEHCIFNRIQNVFRALEVEL